jgi:hypothetical protein
MNAQTRVKFLVAGDILSPGADLAMVRAHFDGPDGCVRVATDCDTLPKVSPMPPSPRALCALVLLVGCATNADSIEVTRKPKKHVTSVAHEAPEDEAPEDEAPAPKAPAPKAPAPEETGAPERPAVATRADEPARPGAAVSPAAPRADPFGDVGFKEVTEKDWTAGTVEKIARQQKIDASEVRLSPGRLRAAFVRSPMVAVPTKPGRRVPPRRHQIIVVDNQGQRVGAFRAIAAAHGDEPPKDLRFLSEDRLVYEVVAPDPVAAPPAPPTAARARAPAARKGKPTGHGAPGRARAAAKATREPPRIADKLAPPPRLFVIQPIAPGARPIRCEGFHFAFTREHDRLAFVAGAAEAGFVSVDGTQVYPRRGRTVVASAPVWSKDGRSLAFLEAPETKAARLVLLAEFDNPTGDTTWELPPTASVDGALVFWAGSGRLVVGRTATRPIFSASFEKEPPRSDSRR